MKSTLKPVAGSESLIGRVMGVFHANETDFKQLYGRPLPNGTTVQDFEDHLIISLFDNAPGSIKFKDASLRGKIDALLNPQNMTGYAMYTGHSNDGVPRIDTFFVPLKYTSSVSQESMFNFLKRQMSIGPMKK